jgi:acyl carrier protein
MKTKIEILDFINEAIEEEKGRSVGIDDMFMDSELDSLGVVLTLVALEEEFGDMKGFTEGEELHGIEELTVRDLVKQCILAISSTSKEQ